MQGNGIQLAFAYNGKLVAAYGIPGLSKPIENTAFVEDRRFRAVYIFGGIIIFNDYPGTEPDDPVIFVGNGKYQPVAETVVYPAAGRLLHQLKRSPVR